MRILILGGTLFLGRAAAQAALDRGHDVTVLHRGIHGAGAVPEAEHLIGDRTGDLRVLEGRRFDAAIDTSGYAPRDVARSSQRLAAAGVEHLSFVSSVNAFRAWPAEPVDEDGPVWGAADRERAAAAQTFDPADYGPAKAACELAAQEALGAGASRSCAPGSCAVPTTTSSACRGGSRASPAAATCSRPAIRRASSS
jgi:2'-hydroxyisoflavone reductase